MMKSRIRIILLICIVAFWHLPAHADLVSINQELTIQRTNSGLIIERNLDLQRRQTNEIMRGYDVTRAVRDLIRKTRDFLVSLKSRRLDQIRGAELNQITATNTKDAIRRNQLAQQVQKRLQRDQMQALKARNRDLNQRIRDLSRR